MNRFVAIDFETANQHPESACAVGCTLIEDGVVVDSYYSLIKPPEKFSAFYYMNIKIHHITKDMVIDAPEFIDIVDELIEFIGDSYLVAHNAVFDMSVLRSLCKYYEIDDFKYSYFCTVELSRRFLPQLHSHRLNSMCDYFEIDLNHHDANSDARACALIVMHIMMNTSIYEIDELLNTYRVKLKRL